MSLLIVIEGSERLMKLEDILNRLLLDCTMCLCCSSSFMFIDLWGAGTVVFAKPAGKLHVYDRDGVSECYRTGDV